VLTRTDYLPTNQVSTALAGREVEHEKASSLYNVHFFLAPRPDLDTVTPCRFNPPTSYAVFREAVLGPIYPQKVPKTGK